MTGDAARGALRLVLGVLLATTVPGAAAVSAQTVNWSGGTGFWDVDTNWFSGSVPSSGNDVVIDVEGVHTVTVRSTGGPFTVNSVNMNGGDETLAITNGSLTLLGESTGDNPTGASVITNYSQSGGTLSGPGDLRITGAAALSGGTMTGGGTTTLQGTTTISGSQFALDDGRVLRNEGSLTWSGFTTINLDPNATNGGVGSIVNTVDAVWNATGNGVMVGAVSADGTPTFDNAGMFVKSGGTGDTFIGAQFNNTGTLEVQMGNVRLAGGSTHTGATLISSGSGSIDFSNGVHSLDAATTLNAVNVAFTNTGTTTIAGVYNVSGTTTLSNGHIATFLPGSDLQSLGTTLALSGFGELNLDAHDVSVVTLTASGIGTVSGTGTLTVTDTASLAGTMTGAGTTHLLEDTTTTINSAFNLDAGRVLLNEGTVNWTGGTINLNPVNTNDGVGHIINAAGATWNATLNTGTITRQAIQTDGVAMFDNAGSFVRSGGGTGTTTINVEFNNTGILEVQTGTVSLDSDSTHTGATITGAGTLRFQGLAGVTHTLDAATSLTTANATFSGGSTTIHGVYDVSGTTLVSGGTANLSAADLVSLGTTLTVSAGVLNLGAHDTTVGSLTQIGGTISGTGTLTVSGVATSTLSGGLMTGTGTTTLQGQTTVSGTGVKNLDGGRTLLNEGELTWLAGNFNLNPNTAVPGVGTIVNALGATWDARGNNMITGSNLAEGVPVFDNFGTFSKTGGTGINPITSIDVQFNNAGTVVVDVGTVVFSRGGTHTGDFEVAEGATLRLANTGGAGVEVSHELNAGAAFSGLGTLVVGAGIATVDTVVANTAINFAGTTNIIGNLTTLVLNDDWETAGLHYQGGTVTGPGNLTVTGAATFANFQVDNIRMTGSGAVILQGETTIGAVGGTRIDIDTGREFRNEGTLTWTATTSSVASIPNEIHLSDGGRIVNAAGAVWHTQGSLNSQGFFNVNAVTANVADNVSSFDNFGTIVATHGGSITATLNNAGTILVESGSFGVSRLSGSTGTVIVNDGAHLVVTGTGTSETGILRLETGGGVIMNSLPDRLTVHLDYDNANFGEGNSFNPVANISNLPVTDPGIVAAGNVAQTITGTAVTLGATTAPVLTIGNVRVGDTTFTYDINNTGTEGPILRGAIQTSVNGANVTDARLSGSGVTAGNFTPIELGSSNSFEVVFTVGTAGLLDPLTGQAVHVINNFRNVGDQLLTFAMAEGAAAYRPAEAEIAPQPIELGNARVGMESPTVLLSVTNTAIADGFSESLNAAVAGTTSGVQANGEIALLGAGMTSADAIAVSMDTSTAGSRNGTVTIALESDSFSTSGLDPLALPSQVIEVTGGVYRVAVGDVAPTVNVDLRFDTGIATQALTVSNLAVSGDAFSEHLDATVTGTTAAVSAVGAVSLLAAGQMSNGIEVGVDTSMVGVQTGSVTIAFESNGALTSGLENLAVGSQEVQVTGTVYRLAEGIAAAQTLPTFVRRGDSVVANVLVANVAPDDGFSENLNAAFGGFTGAIEATNGGPVTGLAPTFGVDFDTLSVTLSTDTVGLKSGSATILFESDGTGINTLGQTALPSQDVIVSSTVTQLANPLVQASLDFGNVQQGSVQQMAITVTNDVALSEQAFTDLLNATFDPVLAAGIASLTGSITGLAGGVSDNTSMVIQIDTSTAGAINTTATVLLVSDGTAFGFGLTELDPQTVQVLGSVQIEGGVFRLAEATINTPQPIDLGNVRVGDTSPTALLSITNSAVDDGFSESLNAAAGATTSGLQAGGSFTLLAAGETNVDSISISMDTSTAGLRDGTATIQFASDGTGTSGFGETPLASQDVMVTGSVFRLAQGEVTPDPLVLNARVGDSVSGALTIANIAAPDGFSESLEVTGVSALGAEFGTTGAVGGLIAAGASDSGVHVTVNTDTAGQFAGTANVTLESSGLGTSDILGNVALGTESVALTANVFQTAIASVTPTINLGVVRVGDVSNTATIDVANVAPVAALNDVLRESGRTVDSDFALDGQVGDVGAGGVSQLTASLMSTMTAGEFSGEILLDLASHNALMTDVSAGSHSVSVEGTVNNLALPEFDLISGDGSLTALGDSLFLLDFGTQLLGTDPLSFSAELGVRNAATGPADDLAGTFFLPIDTLFAFSGFDSFTNLAAGSIFGDLWINLDLDVTGLAPQLLFGQLFLNPLSVFPGLVDLPLSTITLDYRINLVDREEPDAVPEPGAVLLLLCGLAGLGARRARRRSGRPDPKV